MIYTPASPSRLVSPYVRPPSQTIAPHDLRIYFLMIFLTPLLVRTMYMPALRLSRLTSRPSTV